MTYEEDKFISRIEGFLVGSLDEAEQDLLERCIEKRWVHVVYEGGAGLMGFGKVRRRAVDFTNSR